jgi:hypothetical protein
MEIQHLVAKIHVEGVIGIDPVRVVDVFHSWVAKQSMPEMLVDVAELLHVPKGPGVIAVGHDADYTLDHTGGVWGMAYRRKTQLAGGNAERIVQALHAATHAARLLEDAFPGELRFSRTDFELIVNDRGLVPNTAETYAAVVPEIEAALRGLAGGGAFAFTRHDSDPRLRFGLTIKSSKPLDLAAVSA